MKPLVSVVVPYYHGVCYVPGILQMMEKNAKLLFPDSMELIIVNDSPEETVTVPEMSTFSLRVLVNEVNSGIHASRVNGLRTAKGEYVLFLDQDDVITDHCLKSQIHAIGDADLVIANGYDGEADGGRHLIFSDEKKQACAGDLNCQYYYNNLIRSPGQVLIRRNSIPQYWMEHIMKSNGSDDVFLWLLMLCKGCRAAMNLEVLYEHVYTGSNTSGNDAGMLQSQIEVTELLKGIASSSGLHAFRRRAEYYTTTGTAHRLKYLDVGFLRGLYAWRHF